MNTRKEMQVSLTERNGNQANSRISELNNTNLVIVWRDSDARDLYGQRFDYQGTRLGTEFKVNTNTNIDNYSNYQYPAVPSIASIGDGGFVVSWLSNKSGYRGIFGQRFDVSGNKIGSEFQISNCVVCGPNEGGQWTPQVVSTDDGFSIYHSSTKSSKCYINKQVYNSTNSIVETSLIDTMTKSCFAVAVTAISSGEHVFLWREYEYIQSKQSLSIYGQRFNSNDNLKLGDRFQVATFVDEGGYNAPQVISPAEGGFIVTWSGKGTDGDYDVYLRRYNADFTSSTPIQVNTLDSGYEHSSSIAALNRGGYIVSWVQNKNIYIQQYDANNDAVGENQIINLNQNGTKTNPSILSLPKGDFVITWDGYENNQGYNVYASFEEAQPSATPSPSATITPSATVTTTFNPNVSVSVSASAVSTPSVAPSPSPLPFTTQEVKSGGVHNGTSGRDSFVIDVADNVVITGGEGDDIFIVHQHSNVNITITDFDKDKEVIDLSLLNDVRSIDDITITRGSAVVNLPSSQKVILQNLEPSDIGESNFVFAANPSPSVLPSPSASGEMGDGITEGDDVYLYAGLGALAGIIVIAGLGYAIYKNYYKTAEVFSTSPSIVQTAGELNDKTAFTGHHPAVEA